MNFKCNEQVVNRIPNIRKLKISYHEETVDDRYCLDKLDCLEKLESLEIDVSFSELTCLINYPRSLKKLDVCSYQYWQGILDKIGELPFLQKLIIRNGCFGGEWETSEGQFRSLKYLSLVYCGGIFVWTSEASHFPRLEQLRLDRLEHLEEIPSDFAEISTLGLIKLNCCGDSAMESAKRILEEQEALNGEEETTLQVKVKFWATSGTTPKSSSPNFHVTLKS